MAAFDSGGFYGLRRIYGLRWPNAAGTAAGAEGCMDIGAGKNGAEIRLTGFYHVFDRREEDYLYANRS